MVAVACGCRGGRRGVKWLVSHYDVGGECGGWWLGTRWMLKGVGVGACASSTGVGSTVAVGARSARAAGGINLSLEDHQRQWGYDCRFRVRNRSPGGRHRKLRGTFWRGWGCGGRCGVGPCHGWQDRRWCDTYCRWTLLGRGQLSRGITSEVVAPTCVNGGWVGGWVA